MEANFKLKAGDILHCTRQKPLSGVIRWATDSNFSHSAFVLEIWGEIFIIDAQKDGVNIRPLEEWLRMYKYDIVVARKPLSRYRIRKLSKRAASKAGHSGYDFVTLLFRIPYGILTGKWLRERDPHEKFTCSHLILWIFEQENSHQGSPEDVFKFTTRSNYDHRKYVYELDNPKD